MGNNKTPNEPNTLIVFFLYGVRW